MTPPREVPKAQQQHPSDETLSCLARNTLAPNDAVVIQKHVSRCRRCQSVLDELRMEDSHGNENASKTSRSPQAVPAQVQRAQTNIAKEPQKRTEKQTVAVPEELRNHPQYRVLSLIGRGGMGNVFLVEHKLTARKEVLKVIHGHLLSREDVRIRFKREIQSAAKLNHPNVVQTLTAIEEGSMIGLVMEYVQGESLSAMVGRVGPLPVDRARDFVKQIAQGLDHAHQQNMVHRDIKPQNILVAKEGNSFRVRILDFGLAKTTGLAASSSELTIDGSIIGTPNYMAPEQAINPSLADIRSDIYSLGCTWFFLLTGKSPFEAESPLAIMNAHQNTPPPTVRSLRLGVPDETEHILSKMMAKNPDHRFQNPAELIDALSLSWVVPIVEKTPVAIEYEAPSSAMLDLGVHPIKKPTRKKKKSQFETLVHVGMISIPSIALVGVLIFKPHWISNLGNVLRGIDSREIASAPAGSSSIELRKIPPDVQVFIDGFPAKFERMSANASPSIPASPGTYLLSARRNGKEVGNWTVNLKANEVWKLDLAQSIVDVEKPPAPPRPRNAEPPKSEVATTRVLSTEDATEVPVEPNMASFAPLDIYSDGAKTRFEQLGEDIVLGKRFAVQQRLVGHKSSVFRVAFLGDGKLISAESNGIPIPLANKSKSSALQSMSQISIWNKDGTHLNPPNEGTLEDFLAAPNGNYICHVGRVFNAGRTAQLYNKDSSVPIWKSDLTTVGQAKSEMPYFAFSAESDKLFMVSPEGSFTRVNLRPFKVQPPVASLINIDRSTVESMSVSQKLDYALFGLRSGELLIINTRDGKQKSKDTLDSQETPKNSNKPIVAAQFNSKDDRIATLHSDGTVGFLDFSNLNRLENLQQTLAGSIRVLGRSNNGRFLAAIGDRRRVSVYDLEEANVFASWELAKTETATSISVENNGKRIAIGFESGSVVLLQQAKE